MEAVAISTARSALNSVVNTATTAITDEIGLLLGVQEELFFIKAELETMRVFLRWAASTEKVKDQIVIPWIKQVQELAFDVEDCLLEASVHLIKKNCLPVICSVKKRNLFARKIRALKIRIEDVSKRNMRYNQINKENSAKTDDESASTRLTVTVEAFLVGLEDPKKKLVELILKEHGEVISVVGMGGLGKTTLVREVYGCQELTDEFNCFAWITVLHPFNMEEFLEILAKQIRSKAKEVDYNWGTFDGNKIKLEQLPTKIIKEQVTGYLEDKKYLIVLDDLSSVSEWEKIKNVLHPVNGSRIIVTTRLKPLARSISHPSGNIYEINELSENHAFDLFCKTVYKTPDYRLVSDDREMNDDLPLETKCNMKYGSSSSEIMEEVSEVHKQCITINITSDMKTQAGLIIKSCGCLPLAIVAISSYLATKPKTSVEWKTMNDHLSSELGNNPDLGVVKTVLTSSYDGMPYHLKPSLLYLSVFHNHKEIRRSRIIRRWMADGYVTEDRKKTSAEVGKDYFNDLMGRSFIRPSQMNRIDNGYVKTCNIHDMMYELILGKAINENMVSLLDDENLITMTDKLRHLVITGGPYNGDKVLARVQLSHMRSVSIFGKMGDYLKYPRMRLVRVLDLEGTLDLNNRDLRSIGKLRHLKYLGLRGIKITKLPDSLGKLSELETLDIRHTTVVLLPTGVAKLQKLSYLRGGFDLYNSGISHKEMADLVIEKLTSTMSCWPSAIFDWPIKVLVQDPSAIPLMSYIISILFAVCCYGPLYCCSKLYADELNPKYFGIFGVRAPRGIGKLRFLNILGRIDIGMSKVLAKELQNLTNLRKLGVTGFSKKNGITLAKVIDGLKHLRSLFLSAADDLGLRCCLENVSSPPKYLQSLKLYSLLVELPDWISSLENLEKIHFRKTFLAEDIKAIEKLPNLKILYMSSNSFEDLKDMCFGESTFSMLQVLIIEGLKELESVSIEKTALKRLEQIKISKCWSIAQNGVSGLDFLVQLKEMEMVVSYSKRDEMFVRSLQEKLWMLPTNPNLRAFKTEGPEE